MCRRSWVAGTLLILDASLPGGFIEGHGNMRYAQTMTFTTMVWFSIFHVFNAPSDERSAFVGLFTKQMAVGIDPPGNHVTGSGDLHTLSAAAFSTVPLTLGDWLRCIGVASSVLWLRELAKLIDSPRRRRLRTMA